MNDYESVWYLTVVFNHHVSLTTITTPYPDMGSDNKFAVEEATKFLAEITPVDVNIECIENASGLSIDAYSFTSYKNLITATLIKA